MSSLRLLAACAGFAILAPGFVFAQAAGGGTPTPAAPAPATLDSIDKSLKDVVTKLEALRTDLKTIETNVDDHRNALISHATALKSQGAEIDQLKSDVAKLTTDVNDLKTLLNSQNVEIRNLLDLISRDDSRGNRIVSIDNLMQNSPDFRDQMQSAVANSLKTRGVLRVQNAMATPQRMLVNGFEHVIPANARDFEIDVPVGTLTTELLGQEAPKNWTIAPPGYFQELRIEPTGRPVTTTFFAPTSAAVPASAPVAATPLTTTFFAPVIVWP